MVGACMRFQVCRISNRFPPTFFHAGSVILFPTPQVINEQHAPPAGASAGWSRGSGHFRMKYYHVYPSFVNSDIDGHRRRELGIFKRLRGVLSRLTLA